MNVPATLKYTRSHECCLLYTSSGKRTVRAMNSGEWRISKAPTEGATCRHSNASIRHGNLSGIKDLSLIHI